MNPFKERYGSYALVTGASSGIGEEIARELAARGVHPILLARRADKLAALAEELVTAHDVDARVVVVDLSNRDFIDVVLEAIDGLDIGLLVNNAGFGTTGPLLDVDAETSSKMVDVNCRAPLVLTRALAPRLLERGRGGVIITASTMGFGAAAGWATYNATKGFDLLLAEGLAQEFEPHGVDVVALCPGGTTTGFQAAGGIHETTDMPWWIKVTMMEARPVARYALDSLGRRRVAIPGFLYKMIVLSFRLIPRSLTTRILSILVRNLAR